MGDLVLVVALAEETQHLELAGRHVHARRRRAIAGPRATLDEAPYAGDELVDVEGLDDVVVGSDQQARDAIHRLDPVAGHEEER